MKKYNYILIFTFLIFLHYNSNAQISGETEITIVNDILPDIFNGNACLYLFDRNEFNLIPKNISGKYIDLLDSILPREIANELITKATKYADKSSVWHKDEIKNSILLSETDLHNKILRYVLNDSISGQPSQKPNCEKFEILFDSTNISRITNPLTGEIAIDTLDTCYPIILVPEEFYSVLLIVKPVIDNTGRFAIISYATNPFTLMGQGCSILCEKQNNKWKVIFRFNSFAS